MSFVEMKEKKKTGLSTHTNQTVLFKRKHNKCQIKICLCSVSEAFGKHIKTKPKTSEYW